MAKSNREHIGNIMDSLKRGLAPYVLQQYKEYYQSAYLQKMEEKLRYVRLPDSRTVLQEIDVLGWLNLMNRTWHEVFQDKLSRSERGYINQLIDARHSWAHQKDITIDDTHRIADVATVLLKAVGATEHAQVTEEIAQDLLRQRYEKDIQSSDVTHDISKMSTDRTEQLRAIRDEIVNLTQSPLYPYRKENGYFPVIGQGNHYADIMFVGEAPGKNEAETGRPFCGASGRVLDELLESIDLERKQVYVTNIVKDRPPNNRDPLKSEIDLYAPFLLRQIDIIQPQVIATLGRFSMAFILKRFKAFQANQKISHLHGKVIKVRTAYGQASVVPLFHPAAALYNRNQRSTLEADFQVLKPFITPE